MRKASAIFLLVIYVYNLTGYKALFSYLEDQATSSMISKLDKGQYKDADLIEMKIPYKSLYYPSVNQYVRYDGSIEIAGHHYNYVKRKFANDTLYLLCIPNQISNNLASARLNYDNKAEKDASTPEKSKAGTAGNAKSFASDYNFILKAFEFNSPESMVNNYHIITGGKLPSTFTAALYRPPRTLA